MNVSNLYNDALVKTNNKLGHICIFIRGVYKINLRFKKTVIQFKNQIEASRFHGFVWYIVKSYC